MGSFCVVAIVKEPRHIIARFVDWYISQGAEKIVLYFDDPGDTLLTELQGQSGLELHACTPDFWSTMGVKPSARFTRRQNTVLTRAYHCQKCDWLLNVDADELLHFEGQTITDAIAEFPQDAKTVSVQTAEHVMTPTQPGEHFRSPIPRELAREIYGEDAELMERRHGLAGHPEGKSLVRTGLKDIRLRQHWPVSDSGERVEGPVLGPSEGAFLLHYMVEDFERWKEKLSWRVGSWGYPEPIKERVKSIMDKGPEPGADLRALYETLHSLTPERAARLRSAGALHRIELSGGPA